MKKSFLNEILAKNSERKVDDSFTNYLHGLKKVKSINESFSQEALGDELVLFIENEESLNDLIPSLKKLLFKHWRQGEYKTELAERAWYRVVDDGAKKYAEKVGGEPRLWNELFPIAIRKSVTEGFERSFYQDLKKGKVNMEELFNE
jgi:hypothetical protein